MRYEYQEAKDAFERGEASKSFWTKSMMIVEIRLCLNKSFGIHSEAVVDWFKAMPKSELFERFFCVSGHYAVSEYRKNVVYYALDYSAVRAYLDSKYESGYEGAYDE